MAEDLISALKTFLLARIEDDDRQVLRSWDPGRGRLENMAKWYIAAWAVHGDDRYANGMRAAHEYALLAIASVYSDHPDYDPKWERPDWAANYDPTWRP